MGTIKADSQAMIDMCLTCRRKRCSGNCTAVRFAGAADVGEGELYTLRGLSLTLMEWARRFDMDLATLWVRVKRKGWGLERALNTPVRDKRRKYSLAVGGKPVSMVELAARCNVCIGTVEYRVKQGWTGDRIVEHYGGGK